jgi:hypothetical protein
MRVYWHEGPGRIERELRRMARGDCPTWGLPVTASEEERLLASSGEEARCACREAGLIGIAARRRESFDWLSAVCRQREHSTLWLRGPHYPRIEGRMAIIVDGTDFRGKEFADLREIAACYPQSRRIALMDFPRVEDRRRLRAGGAAAVLSKPLDVEELLAALEFQGRDLRCLPPDGARAIRR